MSLASIDGSSNQPQRAGDEIVRVNLLVPATLRKEWKAMALASDKTLTDFIIEAMQHQTDRIKKTENPTA